jgi:hypothetical protein
VAFVLFLLLNCTLFIRPAEIVEQFAGLPIYEWLILSCAVASLPGMLAHLRQTSLAERPITVSVLAMLPAIFLSHISHGVWWAARDGCLDFSKTVIYYLLLVANVNSVKRLRTFTLWVLGFISMAALLAVLQFHGVIELPSLSTVYDVEADPETGIEYQVPRICSTGIFSDPNDLAMILVLGLILTAYFVTDPRLRKLAPVWLGLAGLFFYGLVLTKSRGGLLALAVAFFVLIQARYGWRKALILAGPGVLVMLALVGGRQADIGGAIGGDTGQSRIQLWSQGLALLRGRALMFGIGFGRYVEEVGQVAHNSFVHPFVELGFFGGAVFLGAVYYPIRSLYRLREMRAWQVDRELIRFRPCLLASMSGFAASMLSLTRTYTIPTYLMLGTAAVFLDLSRIARPPRDRRLNVRLVKSIVIVSVLFLAVTYAFIRIFARWSS